MRKITKKTVGFIILIFLTLLVVYFSLKDHFHSIIYQIKHINLLWLIGSFLLFNIYLIFRALVTVQQTHKFTNNYSFWQAFKMEYEILFINGVTPFSTGGKPYEIYALKKNGLKLTESSNIAIQNFIIYQFALILLGLVALLFNKYLDLFSNIAIFRNVVIAGFLVNTLVMAGLFFITFAKCFNKKIVNFIVEIMAKLRLIKNKEKKKMKIYEYLEEFHDGAINLSKNKLKFMLMVLFHFISLICLYTIPLFILYGMGDFTSLTFVTSIIASAYVMLIATVIPMPGGTGGIEYAYIVFYGYFINGVKLNASMLIWRFITFYSGIIIGLILISKNKKHIDNNL